MILQMMADAASAQSSALEDPVTYLISTGVAGVFAALFIMGKIFPKSVVDDLKAECVAKDAIIASKDVLVNTLQASLVEKAIPALTNSTAAIERRDGTGEQSLLEIRQLQQSLRDIITALGQAR